MSHAEALQTLHPAAGATDAIVAFVGALGYGAFRRRRGTTRVATCSTPSAS